MLTLPGDRPPDNTAEVKTSYGETGKNDQAAEQSVCVFINNYRPSPAAGAADDWSDYTSTIRDLPFLDDKAVKVEMLQSDRFPQAGLHCRNSDVRPAPELQDQHLIQEVTMEETSAASRRLQDGGGLFEFNMAAPGKREDNCFICSACGQSFDSFSLFQRHECKNICEQL